MKILQWMVTVAALQLAAGYADAAAVLIRDATVHTMSAAGTLEHTDILIGDDGKIAQLGHGLTAPANAEVIDAGGRPVTPGLFGGFDRHLLPFFAFLLRFARIELNDRALRDEGRDFGRAAPCH